MAENQSAESQASAEAGSSTASFSNYFTSFKAKAASTGSWIKEKSKVAAEATVSSAKKLDDKTGFTATVSVAKTKVGEKLSEFDKRTGISTKTSTALQTAKTGILGGVGAARKSMRLWSNDLRFFDDNRLDTFKLFERFDKDSDGLLNDEEFTSLLFLMFQWFHTQKEEEQHYIPPKTKLEQPVESAKIKAKSSWNIPEKGVDKALFVSNWISFFSELEGINVTFRDAQPDAL